MREAETDREGGQKCADNAARLAGECACLMEKNALGYTIKIIYF